MMSTNTVLAVEAEIEKSNTDIITRVIGDQGGSGNFTIFEVLDNGMIFCEDDLMAYPEEAFQDGMLGSHLYIPHSVIDSLTNSVAENARILGPAALVWAKIDKLTLSGPITWNLATIKAKDKGQGVTLFWEGGGTPLNILNFGIYSGKKLYTPYKEHSDRYN